MKKAIPFIIIGLVLILGIILYVKNKKAKEAQRAADDLNTAPGSSTVNPINSFGSKPILNNASLSSTLNSGTISRTCGCESDATVQEQIATYNSMPNAFPFNNVKPQMKAQILENCPCVKF